MVLNHLPQSSHSSIHPSILSTFHLDAHFPFTFPGMYRFVEQGTHLHFAAFLFFVREGNMADLDYLSTRSKSWISSECLAPDIDRLYVISSGFHSTKYEHHIRDLASCVCISQTIPVLLPAKTTTNSHHHKSFVINSSNSSLYPSLHLLNGSLPCTTSPAPHAILFLSISSVTSPSGHTT
ncbi:hypothetical protein EYC84_009728 [Monilinia fructicola]|uniref:Uncharacterized protein n=1 Tax=Monilinia fructicola TaxID=38448 RepID=A0A5M9JAW7_MONFR|nr:hypothetical protein EYC84_009728 [Monilinia fructicola]